MKFLATASLLAAAASAFPTFVEVAARSDIKCEQKPRTVSIVIDSSGSNQSNDPNNRRLDAASKINAYLNPGEDKISVTKFNTKPEVMYALGAPGAGADSAIRRVEANGGTDVFLGLESGFSELGKSGHDNAALVIFTDGQDDPPKPENKAKKLAALAKAKEQGIRVSWGHLSHPVTKKENKGGLIGAIWDIIIGGSGQKTTVTPGPTIDADISAAALATGGSVATLSDAEAFNKFIDAVIKNGLTNIDAKCTDGNDIGDSGGPINNNVTSYGLCSNNAAATFTYKADKKEKLAVTIELVSKQNKVQIDVTLENKATGVKTSVKVNSGSPSLVLTGAAEPGQDVVVQINPSGASNDQCQYTVKLDAIPEAIASSLSLPPVPSSSAALQPSSSAAPQPSSSAAPQPSSSAAPQPSSSAAPQPSSSAAPQPSSSEACPVPSVPTSTVTSTVIQTVTAPAPSATASASVCICKCDAPGAKPMPKFEL